MEEFEDTKGVIRIGKSKKDRQHNDQKKKDKRTNSDLQNNIQKTKDCATPLRPGMNTGAPDEYVALAPLVAPLVNNMMTTHDVYVKDKYTVVTLKKSCYCDNCFD